MAFVHPIPDEAALDKYNAGYFCNAHGGISTDKLTIAFHSAINLLRVIHVENFQKKQQVQIKNVLEIGPGGGHFARHWLNRNGKQTNYTGIESDTSCHNNLISLGVTVYAGTDQLPLDQSFNLVVISHVLEHTSNPVTFIANCTRLLSPCGILFIEVPCNDYEHKESDEPHLLFFDKGPMQLLLTKTGFGNIRVSYHGKTIADLKKEKPGQSGFMQRARNVLLRNGIIFPFSAKEPGLEGMNDSLERAVIKPFKAHIEQTEPAWWLRAIAIKK